MRRSAVPNREPAQRQDSLPRRRGLITAIAVGGVLGAEARYGVSLAIPHPDRRFPWSTVLVNTSGWWLAVAVG